MPQQGTAAGVARLTPETFAREFAACGRALWCIAAGVLGRRERADDVVQEAALIALRRLETFDGTNFQSWMAQIVRFEAHNERRRAVKGRAADIDTLRVGVAREPGASPVDDRGHLRPQQGVFDDAVVAALNDLEETARTCLLLKTVLDMPYKEISLVLDIPEGTAMSHVHRSRRALRQALTADPRWAGAVPGEAREE